MPKFFQLILSPPKGDPVCHRLTADHVSLGRGYENRIRLEVKAISARHCEFRAASDGYELVDLGSTNGTKVNGVALNGRAVPLKNGDQILFGESVSAHFFAAVDAPSSEPAKNLPRKVVETRREEDDELEDWLPINPVAAAVAQQEGSRHLLRHGGE